ncbi:MAG: 5-(carboxyamino)imidazole ribonucleotide mutase [Deltaproteobacteria bacterium]|nr:MAG: 5-(carboxyamino)imidazole ribonucleotide mutase [Deltaproteobacteria bacterium]
MPQVAIFMGSLSDEDNVRPCADILTQLGIDYALTVTSAHRTPERTSRLVREMEEQGCQVFICAAGLAAHLAGAVAARTIKPVLGIPIACSPLGGWDALLATVQMPPGFPVGTLALDKVGAKNTAWLAAQILALNDPDLAATLKAQRVAMQEEVEKAAQSLA